MQAKPTKTANSSVRGARERLDVRLVRSYYRMAMCSRTVGDIYDQAYRRTARVSLPTALLDALDVRYDVSSGDMARIPRQGPAIVLANHPFGMLEGLILMDLLGAIRPEVKVLANSLLGMVPEMSKHLILVDPYCAGTGANAFALRKAVRFVENGGMLVVFPAGDVARLDLRALCVTEGPWSRTVAGLVRCTHADVVPVHFEGANSPLFHGAGMIHPRIRTMLLLRELLAKRGGRVSVSIGNPLSYRKLGRFDDPGKLASYLRWRVELLAGRRLCELESDANTRHEFPRPEPVAEEIAQGLLTREIDALATDHILAETGDLRVYCAKQARIPLVLLEIGRLREMTFRMVGEGTGRSRDLDRFDFSYRHLFLWDHKHRMIAGAYRLGPVDQVGVDETMSGLYSTTLFGFDTRLIARLSTALELGRSFVRPEYQRTPTALATLWKGIGAFLVRNPRHRLLFGPVSISNEYSSASRRLMVEFLTRNCLLEDESRWVRPRRAFRTPSTRSWEALRSLPDMVSDIEEVSALVMDLERDGKGVPTLLRQYLRLGGRVLAFNVDGAFENAIDGLILVDLAQTERKVLERYMGAEGAASFLEHHRAAETKEDEQRPVVGNRRPRGFSPGFARRAPAAV